MNEGYSIKALNKHEDLFIRLYDTLRLTVKTKQSSIYTEYEINVNEINKINEIKEALCKCFIEKSKFQIKVKIGNDYMKFKYIKNKAFHGIERIKISLYKFEEYDKSDSCYISKSVTLSKESSRNMYRVLNRYIKLNSL